MKDSQIELSQKLMVSKQNSGFTTDRKKKKPEIKMTTIFMGIDFSLSMNYLVRIRLFRTENHQTLKRQKDIKVLLS